METNPSEVAPQPMRAFSFWRWLVLSCVLLIPFALVIGFLIWDGEGFFEIIIYDSFFTYFVILLAALLGGILQWIYFHFQFPRAWTWPVEQMLVYGVSVFLFTLLPRNDLYLLTRNFPFWVRLGSFALILLAFLLPPLLFYFMYFRSRKIPLERGWFRDYALVFAFGLGVFLLYDWFTEGRASPIQAEHGAFYTGMIAFALYLSAGQGWVLERVPFPGLPKKVKKGKASEGAAQKIKIRSEK